MSLVVFYYNKLIFQIAFNLSVTLYLSKITLNAVTMHSESCLNLYRSFFLIAYHIFLDMKRFCALYTERRLLVQGSEDLGLFNSSQSVPLKISV